MEESLKDTEWWWIDYLENEFDAVLEKDLETLLHHSQEDRDSFENFRLLRQWLRDSDPAAGWSLEESVHRVRGNVMAAIVDLEMEASVPERKPRQLLRPVDLGAEV